MATHFICQATEPLPHRFPSARAPEKGHGAVSQYELLNLSDKAHCRFPPPGWDTSESSEDSLPLYRVPAPSWKTAANLIGPDPDLCITPEKSSAGKFNNVQGRQLNAPVPTKVNRDTLIDPDLDLTLTPEKALETNDKEHKSNLRNGVCEDGKFKGQHRVRFELDDSKGSSEGGNEESSFLFPRCRPGKQYKPASYSDDNAKDLIDSTSNSENKSKNKPTQYTVNKVNNKTVYVPLHGSDQSKEMKLADHFDQKSTNQDQTDTISKHEQISVLPEVIYNEQTDTRPVCHIQNHKTQGTRSKHKDIKKPDSSSNSEKDQVFIKGQGDSAPKRKVKVKRETAGQPPLSDYNYPFSDGMPDTSEYEHVFKRPEYNSTLRMRTELQQIKDSEIDVAKALEKKLQLSDTKKTEITEKATSKLNTKDSMFSGLVSLEIPVEDLCNQVEQSKSNKVSSKTSRPKSQTIRHSNEPDLMEFFTAELQKEQGEFSLPGLSAPSESLSTASHFRAFDLYRHNRVWDNNSYFSVKKK
ncbi:uncharacterized protein LOC127719851 [Mytilus californianus]|uniref:uncharacterized protein LOC127719851 n=1 Tax=Mytilus californianus TaxID=6549 RepID=UPI002246DC6D|nr:uncharacterized protein LOC127719851 [Mytilus californianus]XP_052082142.1 uncharacterized protein LOC127719851 [Mytilus californianus]